MSNKKALLLSLGINVFFLALCLIFGNLGFGATDDFFMARLLEGVYGDDYNVHLTFVNVIYGYALLPLYHLFPKVGWYYVGEMFSVFASLVAICFVILRKFDKGWGLLASVLFVAAIATDYYLTVQFTHCASVLSAAGILLLWYGFDSNYCLKGTKSSKVVIILGFVLFLWGSLMRYEAFLMGCPFFALMAFSRFRQNKESRKKIVVLAVVFIAAVMGCKKFNQLNYQSPEYKNYIQFQGPRSVFGDGANYDDRAVDEDMEEMGLQSRDVALLRSWTYYDNKVFSLENILRIYELVKKYPDIPNLFAFPRGLLQNFVGAGNYPLFMLWAFLCILAFCSKKNSIGYIWLSLFCVMLAYSYLFYVGRVVYRVENGLWLYATVFMLAKVESLPKISQKLLFAATMVVALINVFIYSTNGAQVRNVNSGGVMTYKKDTTDYQGFFNYMDSLGDSALVLLPHDQYMDLSFHREPVYRSAEKGSWKKFIPMGFWTPKFPDIEHHIQSVGVTNPFEDVIKDNVYVVDYALLGSFLRDHYNFEVEYKEVKNFNGMIILKYSLVEEAAK